MTLAWHHSAVTEKIHGNLHSDSDGMLLRHLVQQALTRTPSRLSVTDIHLPSLHAILNTVFHPIPWTQCDLLSDQQLTLFLQAIEASMDFSFYHDVIIAPAGGTINMAGEDGRKADQFAMLRIAAERQEIAALTHPRQPRLLPNAPDSSNIGPREWVLMSEHLRRIGAQRARIRAMLNETFGILPDRKSGIVVTHGTDTMELSALVISLEMALHGCSIPIVLTGSHTPADQPVSDAWTNIYRSCYLNTLPQLPPTVYVVIGNEVHAGSDVSKILTMPDKGGGYFFSSGKPLGEFVHGHNIRWNLQRLADLQAAYEHMHVYLNEMRTYKDEPHEYGYVELVDANKAPMAVYWAALERVKAQCNANTHGGIVLHGSFTGPKSKGHAPNRDHYFLMEFRKFLKACQKADVLVYTGSKSTALWVNSISKTDPQAVDQSHFVEQPLKLLPRNFPFNKARAKLSWLLRYFEPTMAAHFMTENVAGELDLPHTFPEQRKYENLAINDPEQGRAVVMAFPGMTARVIQDAVDSLRVEPRHKGPQLIVYGFGDGNLPFGYDNMHTLLDDLVRQDKAPEYLKPIAEYLRQDAHFSLETGALDLFREKEGQVALIKLVKNALLALSDSQRQALLGHYRVNPRAFSRLQHAWNNAHPEQAIHAIPENLADQVDIIFDTLLSELSKRVLKDLLMHGHPMLKTLGTATDRGIHVLMKTQAFRSKTNILLYELGQMSYAMGVTDDEGQRWTYNLFIPA